MGFKKKGIAPILGEVTPLPNNEKEEKKEDTQKPAPILPNTPPSK